jgi:hypothetical protein
MTQPIDPGTTPPPEPTQAAYTPPPVPAPQAYGYPPGAYSPAARPGTPGVIIATGVVLLVLAVLALLWALLFAVYGVLLGSIGSAIQTNTNTFPLSDGNLQDVLDTMRPVIIAIAVFALLVSLAHGAAGIGVIGRRGWARIAGLVLGGLGLALNLLGAVVALIGLGDAHIVTQNGLTYDPAAAALVGVVICVAFAVAYGFVVLTLARRGADFG